MKKALLSVVTVVMTITTMFSQYVSTIAPTQLVCPNQVVEYQFNLPNTDYSTCSITWTITKGSYDLPVNYTLTSNPIRIIWHDSRPNQVEVRLAANYKIKDGSCTSPETYSTTLTNSSRNTLL